MLTRFFGADNQASTTNSIPSSPNLFTDPKAIALITGLGLLNKMNDRNSNPLTVIPQVQQLYKQQAQQNSLNTLANDIKNSPNLRDDATRAIVSDLVNTGNPDLIAKAFELVKTKTSEPFTLSPGAARYDASGKLIAQLPTTISKTEIQKNLEAAGYKPGTKEYKEQIENFLVGGGRGGGVGKQAIALFKAQLKFENPDWDSEKLDKAASAYFTGQNVLDDGTQLPQLSGTAQQYRDQAIKAGTTATLITQGVRANAAEAELQVLNNLSMQDAKPYARTFFGKSPQQVIDTFKNDNESQTRLGKFIASQAAQYEAAQIRNRIAGGEAGITATQELMNKSGQVIDTLYPTLSPKAREVASKTLDDYLQKALQARNAVGIGASAATGNQQGGLNNQSNVSNSSSNEPRIKVISPDNKIGTIPTSQLDSAIQAGYKRA